MEYDLINWSDPYTFVAADFETAALTVFLLSNMYGAKPKDGGESVPVLAPFCDSRQWYIERFGRNPDAALDAKLDDVIASLDSMMLGSFEDRERYEAALDAITDPDKRNEFTSKWLGARSSYNNIGGAAQQIAKILTVRKAAIESGDNSPIETDDKG